MNCLSSFKEKLSVGDSVFGPFMKTSDAAFVEIAGHAGFDFVILDMEHGPVSYENLQNLIRAALVAGILPIVRTADSSETSISKVLDLGALGVQIPQIQNADSAKLVISAAKFYPEGQRGVCRFVRAASYSTMPKEEYFQEANNSLVILQLEGREAIENLDEILNVKGIDIIFIGPYDLSQSLGLPGQIDHPEVIKGMTRIVNEARGKGIVVGTFTDTIESAKMWRKAGIQYISYSVDVGIFSDACTNLIDTLHGIK